MQDVALGVWDSEEVAEKAIDSIEGRDDEDVAEPEAKKAPSKLIQVIEETPE